MHGKCRFIRARKDDFPHESEVQIPEDGVIPAVVPHPMERRLCVRVQRELLLERFPFMNVCQRAIPSKDALRYIVKVELCRVI